jgi:DNA mismatch repair protein MutL
MSNIIQLLPDHIANQIAAGEVIQRPASVVKELMENSVDAGATNIHLVIQDAGKTLIQVIDNGKGMSETDSRLCFERHATSKISQASDLFNLSTNGFRGEALASIAAIAHVELKTKTENEELGFHTIVEGSVVTQHDPCSCAKGSNFSVKNLFYNVPARRNFLKTDKTEFRFINDEFLRLSLAHPSITFRLTHNEKEVFHLPGSTLRQRIVNIFGKKYNNRLAPIEEETDLVRFTGFICKPEFAKKTKKEQYFFVNNRFIKSPYLNHAISVALENFMQEGLHPSYFIFIEVPPESIDVNIHPTKTEIKFENEKILYSILRSCVRKTVGKYNIAPSIDFETNQDYDVSPLINNGILANHPSVTINPNFNPFEETEDRPEPIKQEKSFSTRMKEITQPIEQQTQNDWKDFLQIESRTSDFDSVPKKELFEKEQVSNKKRPVFQLHNKYIVSPIKSGFVLIHQQRAHQRILFQQFEKSISDKNALSQQLLFPHEIHLNANEMSTFNLLKEDIEELGFDFGEINEETIQILGVPYDTNTSNLDQLLEQLLENDDLIDQSIEEKHHQVILSLSKSMCIPVGKELKQEEMNHIIDQLYACENFEFSPSGKKIFINISLNDIDNRFND